MVQKIHVRNGSYRRSDPRDGQTCERRHTHIATEEELDVFRGNWWIRSNFVGSDTVDISHPYFNPVEPAFQSYACLSLHPLLCTLDKSSNASTLAQVRALERTDTHSHKHFHRHDADKASSWLLEALSTLHRLNKAEDKAYYQNGWQSSSSSWWQWQAYGGIPHLRHHHDEGLDTDRTGKPEKSVKRLFICGLSLTLNLVQNYSDHFGNS